jgi:hypothetical protein
MQDKDKYHTWEISGYVLRSFHFVLSASFVAIKFFEFYPEAPKNMEGTHL